MWIVSLETRSNMIPIKYHIEKVQGAYFSSYLLYIIMCEELSPNTTRRDVAYNPRLLGQ